MWLFPVRDILSNLPAFQDLNAIKWSILSTWFLGLWAPQKEPSCFCMVKSKLYSRAHIECKFLIKKSRLQVLIFLIQRYSRNFYFNFHFFYLHIFIEIFSTRVTWQIRRKFRLLCRQRSNECEKIWVFDPSRIRSRLFPSHGSKAKRLKINKTIFNSRQGVILTLDGCRL